MKILIELVLVILAGGAFVTLNFVIFRIPIKNNDKQIVILALVIGTINFYFKFVIHSDIYMYIQTVAYMITLMILRKYPIFYAFIVCSIGMIVISLLDALLTISALQLKLSTLDQMNSDIVHFTIFHLISPVSYLLVAYILFKYNKGFSFVKRRFIGIDPLKIYNFIWATILIVGTIFLQVSDTKLPKFSLQWYILIGIVILLLLSVTYSFFQNKKAIIDRYGVKND
jgi:hypothetical protein